MNPTDLTPAIGQQAAEPIATTADGQSNTGRTMADMILAQQFLSAVTAASLPHRGLRRTRIIPPPQVEGHAGPRGGGCGCGPGSWG